MLSFTINFKYCILHCLSLINNKLKKAKLYIQHIVQFKVLKD